MKTSHEKPRDATVPPDESNLETKQLPFGDWLKEQWDADLAQGYRPLSKGGDA
jgi:hypothetical protein